MAIRLNEEAYEQARQLVREGRLVCDARDAWSEHEPTPTDENAYLRTHGYRQYGRWFLAIDDAEPEDSKARYRFPYGDFRCVHRCAVLSIESRTAHVHVVLERAAAVLHEMIDGRGEHPRP